MLAYNHSTPTVIITVFVMQGCGACEEFKPRLRRIYAQMQQQGYCLPPVEFVDANAPAAQEAANHFGVQFTPTTILRKANGRWRKWDAAMPDEQIASMLQLAARGQHCEI